MGRRRRQTAAAAADQNTTGRLSSLTERLDVGNMSDPARGLTNAPVAEAVAPRVD